MIRFIMRPLKRTTCPGIKHSTGLRATIRLHTAVSNRSAFHLATALTPNRSHPKIYYRHTTTGPPAKIPKLPVKLPSEVEKNISDWLQIPQDHSICNTDTPFSPLAGNDPSRNDDNGRSFDRVQSRRARANRPVATPYAAAHSRTPGGY